MTHNPIRSKWSLGLIALASRPQGTNTYECARVLGGTRDHASNNLKALSKSGHLSLVAEDRSVNRLNQYFISGEHAVAWKETPDVRKPNAAYRDRADAAKKNHKKGASIAPPKRMSRIQTATWKRAPITGNVNIKPTVVRSQGLALGHDVRFQIGPEAAAEFEGSFLQEWKQLRGER